MYGHGLLPSLLSIVVAAASQPSTDSLQSSATLRSVIDGNVHGSSLDFLTDPGWWHWLPGHGGFPGWGHHPEGCKRIQNKFRPGTNAKGSKNYARAEAVKQYYVDSFNQYSEYAFGKDSFNPVAKTGGYGGGGWGLIIIDGIDTALVMGLKDIVDRQLAFIAKQDFTTSIDPRVDGFDTTIRVIGGLLSAYDLINSGKVPYAKLYDKKHVNALLQAARDTADLISPLFNSPTGLPYFWLDMTSGETYGGINTAIAGTIILEYHRLSDLTGDEKYRKQADKANSYLLNPQPEPQFPNLVGSQIDVESGKFTTMDAGWFSGIDSFYEYLIKSVIYDPKQKLAKIYEDYWVTAVDSTIKHLAVHPYGKDEVTWISALNNTGFPAWQMDDYSCFAGGNFLLGGKYLGRQDFMELGLALTDSCQGLFNSTTSGLNPLTIAFYGPDGQASNPAYNGEGETAKKAREYYNAKNQGYFINTESGFSNLNTLYPEPIESTMYAYRITGESIWQENNWENFVAMRNDTMRDGIVASSLWDVTQPYGGGAFPDVPSYFFAETLKYFYLTFSDPSLVSLDDFQFNTEGHPLRVQGGTCSTPKRPGKGIFGWWPF